MENLINEIMTKYDCNKDQAVQIIHNAIDKSNVVKIAIKNQIEKEYSL